MIIVDGEVEEDSELVSVVIVELVDDGDAEEAPGSDEDFVLAGDDSRVECSDA